MSYQLIAFCGQAGSGKDTCADLLINSYKNAVKIAFADPLKTEVSNAFCVDKSYFYRPELKEIKQTSLAIYKANDPHFIEQMQCNGVDIDQPRSPRQIMQWWGTEYRRQASLDYWVQSMYDTLCELLKQGYTTLIIPDVRFPNEANMVRNLGGTLIRVNRKNTRSPAHASEQVESLAPFCSASIQNNGSFEDLSHELTLLLSHLMESSL